MAQAESRRYAVVAILLHWAIAIGILAMIPFGWWMSDLIHEPETRAHGVAAFQLHKSIGLSILVLSLARLGWRLMNPPPPLPSGMTQWERLAAVATHWGFYAIMIALPLSGWAYVSSGFDAEGRPLAAPTYWFGLFEVPHLPIANAAEGVRQAAAAASMSAHSALAWGAIVLAVLHVAGALKHQILSKDSVMSRMVPGVPNPEGDEPASPARRLSLGVGLGAVVLAALALTIVALTPPANSEPSPETAAATASAIPAATAGAGALPIQDNRAAQVWRIDPSSSSIRFTGQNAGAAFSGQFPRFTGDIAFNPNALARSRVRIAIDTTAITMADAMQATTLRQREWFDVANFDDAEFKAETFRALGGDRFEATGTLEIKGQEIPVVLPFTVTIANGVATMTGEVRIDRVAAGLGLTTDPNAQWVSREIVVSIQVRATEAR
jgi:cytochrome b561